MKPQKMLLLLVLSLLLLAASPARAQVVDIQQLMGSQNKNHTLTVDTADLLDCYGVAEGDRLVSVNMPSRITLNSPLVLLGTDSDLFEQNGFYAYTATHPLDGDLIVGDGVRTYLNRTLDKYDLVLIGGPEHNNYTRELVDEGVLSINETSVKMPGLVLERAMRPNGHAIIVLGDVLGYPYHKKDLPLNNVLPEGMAPAASIALGIGLGVLGMALNQLSFYRSLQSRARDALNRYLNAHNAEAASERLAPANLLAPGAGKIKLFGYSLLELLSIFICPVIFGIAFIVADRIGQDMSTVTVFIAMGFLVIIAHDLGHRLVARRLKVEGEYRLWGLGSIILLLTSWLFGMAFSQPGRFEIRAEGLSRRQIALVTLTGPAINLVMALLFLPFALAGGILGVLGALGFTMSLVTVIYNLMPFDPMDGKAIYEWSKLFWVMMFVPLALFFIIMMIYFI